MIEHTKNWSRIPVAAGGLMLEGDLNIPENACGIVLLAHGSSNVENGNFYGAIAQVLQEAKLATLMIDLLTAEEEKMDQDTQFFRDNVSILSQRIIGIANWLQEYAQTANLAIGYFGTGASGAAALVAGAERPDIVNAIVSCGGRTDLAEAYVSRIMAPTLFIVGEKDTSGVKTDQKVEGEPAVYDNRPFKPPVRKIETIPGVAQLFETEESLKKVADLASQWFERYLEPILRLPD